MKATPGDLRARIDSELNLCLERLEDDYAAHSATGIVEEVRRAVFPGGKRLRPSLCCWGHLACGGEPSAPIFKAAASLELLHAFAILHDDIMDSPTARRKRPPAQSRIAAERRRSGVAKGAGRFGESIAMLAGDLALVASDGLFVESGFEPAQLAAAWGPLSRMRLDAVAGQYLDLSLSGTDVDPEAAATIARLKSGSYSVRGPLILGATLAGAPAAAMDALSSFGESAGEAFQLGDDLSGMFGDPAVTGKDSESDLSGGKPTLLVALALELSTSEARSHIKRAWGNPEATTGQIKSAREAITASGAPERTAEKIRRLISQAKAALDDPASSGLDPGPCSYLLALADGIQSQAERFV